MLPITLPIKRCRAGCAQSTPWTGWTCWSGRTSLGGSRGAVWTVVVGFGVRRSRVRTDRIFTRWLSDRVSFRQARRPIVYVVHGAKRFRRSASRRRRSGASETSLELSAALLTGNRRLGRNSGEPRQVGGSNPIRSTGSVDVTTNRASPLVMWASECPIARPIARETLRGLLEPRAVDTEREAPGEKDLVLSPRD